MSPRAFANDDVPLSANNDSQFKSFFGRSEIPMAVMWSSSSLNSTAEAVPADGATPNPNIPHQRPISAANPLVNPDWRIKNTKSSTTAPHSRGHGLGLGGTFAGARHRGGNRRNSASGDVKLRASGFAGSGPRAKKKPGPKTQNCEASLATR